MCCTWSRPTGTLSALKTRMSAAISTVAVDGSLVGVRAVEDALARHASQVPGQLGDLGYVALAVEPDLVGLEPRSQPGRRDLQRRALRAGGILRLDQAVQVGQEV